MTLLSFIRSPSLNRPGLPAGDMDHFSAHLHFHAESRTIDKDIQRTKLDSSTVQARRFVLGQRQSIQSSTYETDVSWQIIIENPSVWSFLFLLLRNLCLDRIPSTGHLNIVLCDAVTLIFCHSSSSSTIASQNVSDLKRRWRPSLFNTEGINYGFDEKLKTNPEKDTRMMMSLALIVQVQVNIAYVFFFDGETFPSPRFDSSSIFKLNVDSSRKGSKRWHETEKDRRHCDMLIKCIAFFTLKTNLLLVNIVS